MHKTIVVISNTILDDDIFSGLDYIIISNPMFKDINSIILNDDLLTYDYLITDYNYEPLNLLTEDKLIITNQYFETSKDNIFAYKNVKSELIVSMQLQTIIDFIKNPF